MKKALGLMASVLILIAASAYSSSAPAAVLTPNQAKVTRANLRLPTCTT